MRLIFSVILSLSLLLNSAFAANNSLPFNGSNFIKAGSGNSQHDLATFLGFSSDITTDTLIPRVDTSVGGGLISILVLLYQIGDIVAVTVLALLGISILLMGPRDSSSQKKAHFKEALVPYIVGLLLYIVGVPLAVFIIKIIIQFF